MCEPNDETQSVLVLASASPRRENLLALLGLPFVARPADVEEVNHSGEGPEAMAVRLSEAKARAVSLAVPGGVIIAADTLVYLDGQVLGKPADGSAAIDTPRCTCVATARTRLPPTCRAVIRWTRRVPTPSSTAGFAPSSVSRAATLTSWDCRCAICTKCSAQPDLRLQRRRLLPATISTVVSVPWLTGFWVKSRMARDAAMGIGAGS
jgi:hypothetical protein